MIRQCSRPTCSEPAAATLSYDYARGLAWIGPLTAERDPHDYDLCRRHADRVRVPHGWSFSDRRSESAASSASPDGVPALPLAV
ncbi:MAG: DUF3499 family protein [Acidimicrobiia bacterium]